MNNKKIVLTTINETKEEIESFRKELITKGEKLPDVKAIAKSLREIEKVINSIKKLCKDEVRSLELRSEKLSYAQLVELLENADIMFEVINDNLPNGMMLKSIDSNIESEKLKEIWFNDNKVGHIQILDEVEDTLCIETSINDSTERFEVVKPNRMYHIISYINTKFNYE